MRVALHPCYILHQRPYRESSLIAEAFSREHGRVALVVKGARRQRNPQRSLYQPLRRLNIAWSMRGELGTLTQIEAAGAAMEFSGRNLMSAFYVNELLMRLLHRYESHPDLFDAYESVLAGLFGAAAHEETCLRVFEKRLLLCLGYGLVLDHDVATGAALASGRDYFYDLDRGPMERPSSKARCVRISGATLKALQSERFGAAAELLEAKSLLRQILAQHLGSRPLVSRELYRRYLNERLRP